MNTKELIRTLSGAFILTIVGMTSMCQTQGSKIDYKSFTVSASQKLVMINWVIDSSADANYFEIQRSVDGTNFKTVALVMGADPKKAEGNSYEGFDKPDAHSKKYFYRLKHISADGEIELSATKMLAIN